MTTSISSSSRLPVLIVAALVVLALLIVFAVKFAPASSSPESAYWLHFEGTHGPGEGKHIVLVSGDEEYRSEEACPMLAKILSQHHGFDCTVLFAINPENDLIDPNFQHNIPGLEALDSADLMILFTRFRGLPDEQMKHIVDYVNAGKPIIGLRTSTHAFNFADDFETSYRDWTWTSKDWPGGFGQQILGDTWVSHHGKHKHEATRAVIEEANAENAVLKGVEDVFGPTDVYGINKLPDSATILLRGQVLSGMEPDSPPVEGEKNDPMMPIAWLKPYTAPDSGKEGQVFCTTMGASIDLESEDLRRLIVNAAYYLTGLESKISAEADVELVDPFEPSFYGFQKAEGYWQHRGLVPADFALGSVPPKEEPMPEPAKKEQQ